MEMASFDANYIQRLVAGDPETERHFASYFGELLWIKLRSRIRSPQLLEDVRQETFLRVLRNLRNSGLEHPERLGAYVHSVCHNVMLEAFRKESRFTEIGEEGAAMIDQRAGAEEKYVTRERKEQVDAVLKELPEKDRELLMAVFIREMDKDVVCRKYGVDRSYLRVLLYRARTRFRAVFSDSYATAP
jgi:RNA polymerase sigma-70 factor (ECF subfamily)